MSATLKNILITILILVGIAVLALIGLSIHYARSCSERFEKAVALESGTKADLTLKVQQSGAEINPEQIYADQVFETIINMYEDVAKNCNVYAGTALESAERLKKAREGAKQLAKEAEEGKRIAELLGIDYAYLKDFPEGAKVTYYRGSSDSYTFNFSDWNCSTYYSESNTDTGMFLIDLKSPVEKGPSNLFMKVRIILPSKLAQYKYISAGRLHSGSDLNIQETYLFFSIPEYVNYRGREIFFKMNDLESDSGNVVIIDPLDKPDGDRVKLLARDLLVAKKGEQSASSRISIEINFICHTVE
ncbi:MAG TPA: hypothetical protein VII00_06310 [bacterium]